MQLRLDALFEAVFDAEIGGGAAVYAGGILSVARLALLRFQIAPIEGERCQIQKFRELFAVDGILLRRFAFVQHEEIRAELELVRRLLDLNSDVLRQRGAVGGLDIEHRVALTVQLDAALHARVEKIALRVKGF